MLPAEPASPCVLLVEDDTTLRQFLCIHLERERINVDVAEDGAEALRLLQLRTYAVVVLDLNLPKVSGWELLDFLSMARIDHIPKVVIITAEELGSTGLVDSALVHRTFTKPVQFEAVARAVRELCGKN